MTSVYAQSFFGGSDNKVAQTSSRSSDYRVRQVTVGADSTGDKRPSKTEMKAAVELHADYQ